MKTHFFALLLCSAIATAQNKFQLGIGGDLGFGKIELNDQKLNSVTQSASVQVEYSMGYISIDGGLEYVTSRADWSNSGNIYLSEFKSLRIPVGISTRLNFSNSDEPENTFPKISVLVGIGLYGNYLMKYEIKDFTEDTDIGWNLGSYGKLGINFNVNSTLTLGMGFKTDLDFSEIEKEQNIDFKQNRNTIFLNCTFKI